MKPIDHSPTTDQIKTRMKEIFNAEKDPCCRTTFEKLERYANTTHGGFRRWLKLYKQAERELK